MRKAYMYKYTPTSKIYFYINKARCRITCKVGHHKLSGLWKVGYQSSKNSSSHASLFE